MYCDPERVLYCVRAQFRELIQHIGEDTFQMKAYGVLRHYGLYSEFLPEKQLAPYTRHVERMLSLWSGPEHRYDWLW